jgi:acyl carrier protein
MSIVGKVRDHILANYLFTDDPGALVDTRSFMEEGILDSTGIMGVILFVEEEFGFPVDDEEMIPENLDSVDNLVAFIRRKQSA